MLSQCFPLLLPPPQRQYYSRRPCLTSINLPNCPPIPITISFTGPILRSPIEREDKLSSKLIQKLVGPQCLPAVLMLRKSPQVTKLCGPEPITKYCVIGVFALQLTCAILLRNTPILSFPFCLTAYIIGATANQNLFLAIHEISHNLAFKSPFLNRLIAVFANLPIGVPYSAAFRVSLMPIFAFLFFRRKHHTNSLRYR